MIDRLPPRRTPLFAAINWPRVAEALFWTACMFGGLALLALAGALASGA